MILCKPEMKELRMSLEATRFKEEWERLQQTQDRTRRIIAIHEASHCVLATYFGFTVHWLSIIPAKDSLGHCTRCIADYQCLGEAEARHSAIKEILVVAGGSCGESLVTRRRLPTIDRLALGGGASDHRRVWELVPEIIGRLEEDATYRERLLYSRACRSFLNYQISRAYALIRSEPFRTVALALANELLGWQELSGDQAREIMLKTINLIEEDSPKHFPIY